MERVFFAPAAPRAVIMRSHLQVDSPYNLSPLRRSTEILRVAVYTAESTGPIQRRAAQLAEQLCLPRVNSLTTAYDALLTVTTERLELRFIRPGAPKPLFVDFVGGRLGYARSLNRFGLLYRAVGFRAGRPTVLDATAGFGADAFRLAWHGCEVTAVERCSVPFALMRDGLERAERAPDIHSRLGSRLSLRHGDARDDLQQKVLGAPRAGLFDVVYLDPMFPPEKKSSLARVEMRILRQLVGDDGDAETLFGLACDAARQRVVVKRPCRAAPLRPHPTHSYSDTTTRYDVYVRSPSVT
jgi:16S rRNA (guanine1516-N2)-methyltransferase